MTEAEDSCLVLVGRYVVLNVLGQGGSGRVHEGLDLRTKRRVAIKLALGETPEALSTSIEDLRREEAVLRMLRPCKYIVQFLDGGEWSGGYFLVLEYLDGPCLEDILEAKRRFPPDLAVRIMLQVLKALNAVHAAGLVHRDVKPSNLLWTSGAIRLIDFGLTSPPKPRADTEDSFTYGTIGYIAPEAIRSPTSYDRRSDVYGCGHLLYKMLSGQHALFGQDEGRYTQIKLLRRHLHRPPTPFAQAAPEACISSKLERITFKALEKDPDKRFQKTGKMYRALLSALP